MKGFFSYILRCADGTLYSGFTTDPSARLAAHNAGKGAKYTRSHRPVELVALWQWPDKHAAMSAEWHVKHLSREQKERLIARKARLEGGRHISEKRLIQIFSDKQSKEGATK